MKNEESAEKAGRFRESSAAKFVKKISIYPAIFSMLPLLYFHAGIFYAAYCQKKQAY